jgi:hypothetical protein
MSTPICTLTLHLLADGNFAYAYTAEPKHEVQLGQFAIPLSQLLATTLQNSTVRVPTLAEREAQLAEAQEATATPEAELHS